MSYPKLFVLIALFVIVILAAWMFSAPDAVPEIDYSTNTPSPPTPTLVVTVSAQSTLFVFPPKFSDGILSITQPNKVDEATKSGGYRPEETKSEVNDQPDDDRNPSDSNGRPTPSSSDSVRP